MAQIGIEVHVILLTRTIAIYRKAITYLFGTIDSELVGGAMYEIEIVILGIVTASKYTLFWFMDYERESKGETKLGSLACTGFPKT